MEYSKCMDDMLSFNHVYNTLKTRGPFAIRRVKQFQFIFHEGGDMGVAWHEDLNFDIMIWQLPATIDSIRPLQVGTTEDHHRWQLVAILRIQAVDTKKPPKIKITLPCACNMRCLCIVVTWPCWSKIQYKRKIPTLQLVIAKINFTDFKIFVISPFKKCKTAIHTIHLSTPSFI